MLYSTEYQARVPDRSGIRQLSVAIMTLAYPTRGLNTVTGFRLIGAAPDKAGVLSFALKGCATGEVSGTLNRERIAVRTARHCAQPILRCSG